MRVVEVPREPPVQVDLDDGREVVRHLGNLVHEAARGMYWYLRQTVELDDLTQDGMIGLLQAASTYDPDLGASIISHSNRRIRGAMLDGVRERDFLPRGVRTLQRQIGALSGEAEGQLSRGEIRQATGCSDADLDRAFAASRPVASIDEMAELPPDELIGYDDELGDAALQLAFSWLDEREQLILRMYYWQEKTQMEIGHAIGLGESGVHVARRKAEVRLRESYLLITGDDEDA